MTIQGISSMDRGSASVTQFKSNATQIKSSANQAIEQKANHVQNKKTSIGMERANKDRNQANAVKQTLSEEDVLRAIEKANSSIDFNNARFEYSIHEDTKRIMVKIVDTVNDETIKEIPAEEVLDMVAKIWEMSGILLDEKR